MSENYHPNPALAEHIDRFLETLPRITERHEEIFCVFSPEEPDTAQFTIGAAPEGGVKLSLLAKRFVGIKLSYEDGKAGVDIGFCDTEDASNGIIRSPGMTAYDEPGDPINYEEGMKFIVDFLFNGTVPAFCLA